MLGGGMYALDVIVVYMFKFVTLNLLVMHLNLFIVHGFRV